MPFWPDIPWLGFIALAVAFWLGQIFNDVFNPNSWFRNWVTSVRGFGEWTPIMYRSEYLVPPQKHFEETGGKRDFLIISVGIDLKAYTPKPIEVFCSAYSFRLTGGTLQRITEKPYEWQFSVDGPLPKGRQVNIDLAYLDQKSVQGYWGTIAPEAFWIGPGKAYLVIIEVRSGQYSQKKRLMLKVPQDKTSVCYENWSIEPGARFSIYEEDRGLFDDIPEELSKRLL